jgi:hypothetical protein
MGVKYLKRTLNLIIMRIYNKIDGSGLYVESSYEHKMIPNLLNLYLPEKAEYKSNMVPYHAFVSVNYKNVNFPEFADKGIGANGLVNYFPADLRDDGVYDLLFNEKDEELSFLFETQPSLTKLVTNNVDKVLIVKHCPEKAKGEYFLMPETLAVYYDDNNAFFRLVPSLKELPEDRSLKHTIACQKRLETAVKMFLSKVEGIKTYSLTPDVQKIMDEKDYARKVDSGELAGLKASVDAMRAEMNQGFSNLEQAIYANAQDIIAAIPTGEQNEFMWNAYQALTSKLDRIEDVFNQNDKIYSTLKKVKSKTGKLEDSIEMALGELLKDKVSLNLKLKKGFDKGDVYVAKSGKTFKLIGTVQPLSEGFKFKKLKSNFEIKNALYNDEPKEMKDGYVQIKDKLEMNQLGELELLIASPEQQLDFEATVIGKVVIEGKNYSVMQDSERIAIKPGNVTAENAKKWGKKLLKFAVPRIAKALQD